MKKQCILVIGGGGYVGSNLVPLLLQNNFKVIVLDLFIFGSDKLPINKDLFIIKGDIRDKEIVESTLDAVDHVIHLACISNDPSFELNPKLGKSINYDSFKILCSILEKNNQIKKFIFASSSSVYGLKDSKDVTEEMKLEPLTDYSFYKVKCEELLLNISNKNIEKIILRPATVCGYSKRQRLDVIVNIMTSHAYNKKLITIHGGTQLRPNINIKDMSRSYLHILNSNDLNLNNSIFNVGYENLSLNEIANIVAMNVKKFGEIKIEKQVSNDLRSYHISSKKISSITNFKFHYDINEAVNSLIEAFEKNILINPLTNENYVNIKRIQSLNLK